MIALTDVCKSYNSDGREVRALWEIHLQIASGHFAVLRGPSGAGKTTLLSVIGAMVRPSSGRVSINGMVLDNCSDVQLARIRRRIGFVFQSGALLPRLPIWENVTYPLIPRGASCAARRELASVALAKVQLDSVLDRLPGQLSGGEQQRVALARALAVEPDLLLLDEPTSNLDESAADHFRAILKELHTEGVTIVVSSHDANLLDPADTVIELDRGQLKCA